MVDIVFDSIFKKKLEKIKDNLLKSKVKKKVRRIIKYPKLGKPMRYARKGAREVYIHPFRLSYLYSKKKDKIIFLALYHKDKQ